MTNATEALCGLWIDDDGAAHACYATADGGRREQTEEFQPFAWLSVPFEHPGVTCEPLKGEGAYPWLAHAESLPLFREFAKAAGAVAKLDILRPDESQWLLQRRARLYGDLPFAAMRRCQLDIETGAAAAGSFSDARNPGDRILAIGLLCGERREL